MGHIFVVGLGSNLGDRAHSFTRALDRLATLPASIQAASRVYESRALGPEQPDYLNAAVRLATEVSAETLLDRLLAVEAACGRIRGVRWGPRTLDLDILWGSETTESDRLTVPHAQLLLRTFALAPLLDVAPELAPTYAPALQQLGGAPAVYGTLGFDPQSSSWAFTAARNAL
jgi:2-amino-4-hydroxy-6-hydroxymethyldihydropteridine diphosphokinase